MYIHNKWRIALREERSLPWGVFGPPMPLRFFEPPIPLPFLFGFCVIVSVGIGATSDQDDCKTALMGGVCFCK